MPVTMTITIDDTGNINVNGPIDNKMVSYGMLEAARDAIYDYHVAKVRSVQPPTSADIVALSRQFHKKD